MTPTESERMSAGLPYVDQDTCESLEVHNCAFLLHFFPFCVKSSCSLPLRSRSWKRLASLSYSDADED